ncbi:MAG: GIY-YIG nuclease family protein [Bacteroidota bacterium]
MDPQSFAYVYILSNPVGSTLYVGVTTNLKQRIIDHKNGVGSAFTRKYGLALLVWYEGHHDINVAIKREKQLKRWQRSWKEELIKKMNPDWRDLYEDIMGY